MRRVPCASTANARLAASACRFACGPGGLASAAQSLSRAPPPRPRRSRARPKAALRAPLRALCSHRPRHLLVHAAHARASRRRAPQAAARRRDGQAANGGLRRSLPCVPWGVHMRACVRLCVLRPMRALVSLANAHSALCVRYAALVRRCSRIHTIRCVRHGTRAACGTARRLWRRRTSARTRSCAKQTDASACVAQAASRMR